MDGIFDIAILDSQSSDRSVLLNMTNTMIRRERVNLLDNMLTPERIMRQGIFQYSKSRTLSYDHFAAYRDNR